ncbi:unnamed protein product [Durusdinium trenchii]|uniref:Calmodulin n=1 Tax=Durusdinium trenchii TaxID=1381693 RepID=A0ABP0HQB7_9DINO
MPQLDFSHGAAPFTDNDIHAQIAITKELFLLVIQDRCVQRLMDELDLPPDRANLFEAIDADGSGTLHVTELVQAPWPFRTKGSVMLDLSRGSRGPLPGLFVSVYCLQ